MGERMKKFLVLLSILCFGAYADTINLHWLNEDGSTYQNSTCTVDSDLNIPTTPPTKYGYTFTGWEIVNYTPIEYLESTGTQYIDTEYIPKIGTKFKIRVQSLSSGTMDFAGLTSTRASNVQYSYFAPLVVQNNKCIYYFNSYHITNAECRNSDVITASIQVMSTSAQIIQNNETLNQINTYTQSGVFERTHSLYLFAGHKYSGGDSPSEISTAKIFYAKIWENDVLVRDFIPVLDEDGVPCMFDKVEGKFYYNQGTGQFIAGPVLTE